MKPTPLEKSLEQLDLQGVLLLQSLLAQQALKLLFTAQQVQDKAKSVLSVPVKPPSLILPKVM